MLENTAAAFTHPKNVVFGAGRVIYVDGHEFQPSGWHLPGQRVTADPAEAERIARAIHVLTIENSGYSGTGFVGRSVRE